MKEKVLVLASVASMIDQFNMSNIAILINLGYEVHVACNFEKGSTFTTEKNEKLKDKLEKLNIKYYHIDFTRSVFNILKDVKAYKQVKSLIQKNHYKFVHCHSPIGGAIGRLVCRSTNTKCIYTAHGFHFFKGAPMINWIIFYPIEKILSRYTDILITINKEDYNIASKKFKMKILEYVPGIGIDIEKFKLGSKKDEIRNKMGVPNDAIILISIGELNKNKNHSTVIKALSKISDSNIHYYIVGQGKLKKELQELSTKLNIDNQVHLLGFRNDVQELLAMADIFIFPSHREGLSVSLMEAMASGLPCIVSNIRGNTDLIIEESGGYLFNQKDYKECAERIKELCNKSDTSLMGKYNENRMSKFSNVYVNKKMKKIYSK